MQRRPGNTAERPSFAARVSSRLPLFLLVASAVVLHGPANNVRADLTPAPLQRIPPGTVVWEEPENGFSDVILFVKGKLGAGDMDSVTENMNYYGELFNLVYMAKVKEESGRRPALDRIAVGFSTRIKGKDVVVSSDTANTLGAKLSLIGRSVLSGNEDALQKIKLTASTRTFAVVDAPAVVQFQNRHQTMIARFVIWVSPGGKVGTVVWLLQKVKNQYVFAEKTIQYLPPRMVENRVMHVDGSQITFGMPSASAFAMVSIPQGTPYPVTDRLRLAGAAAQFTAESLDELAASLSEAMGMK